MAYTPIPTTSQPEVNSTVNNNSPDRRGYNSHKVRDFVSQAIDYTLFFMAAGSSYIGSGLIATSDDNDNSKFIEGCCFMALAATCFVAGVTRNVVTSNNRIDRALNEQSLRFTLHPPASSVDTSESHQENHDEIPGQGPASV